MISNRRLLFYKRKFKKIDETHYLSKNIEQINQTIPKTIWFLWLQGLESSPAIVRKCYNTLIKALPDYNIIFLTAENMLDHIQLPDYIIKKWRQGLITNTHFSDILRLELLIRHGGIWIDSTVLLTQNRIPDEIEKADLFYFQVLQPGYSTINVSSWFISAKPQNPILSLTRDFIYFYWQKHNKLHNYFLLHYCLVIACERLSNEYKKIPKYSSAPPHVLQSELFEIFNANRFAEIVKMSFVQKLTYKFTKEQESIQNTFYQEILHTEI
ncbi:capsular biosynthesis protein [Treponema phagedenis]|uniref:capsular polysaccharide synthesis protein n=1 Tax=Treponema phagedenis TaxID=162 RepID=UPI00198154D0|nr:capsular polysaccharide synthesis protein [Treponema phagedenis]QSH99414.1 capsular biosynthesis protein [Treponema phagedenis]